AWGASRISAVRSTVTVCLLGGDLALPKLGTARFADRRALLTCCDICLSVASRWRESFVMFAKMRRLTYVHIADRMSGQWDAGTIIDTSISLSRAGPMMRPSGATESNPHHVFHRHSLGAGVDAAG